MTRLGDFTSTQQQQYTPEQARELATNRTDKGVDISSLESSTATGLIEDLQGAMASDGAVQLITDINAVTGVVSYGEISREDVQELLSQLLAATGMGGLRLADIVMPATWSQSESQIEGVQAWTSASQNTGLNSDRYDQTNNQISGSGDPDKFSELNQQIGQMDFKAWVHDPNAEALYSEHRADLEQQVRDSFRSASGDYTIAKDKVDQVVAIYLDAYDGAWANALAGSVNDRMPSYDKDTPLQKVSELQHANQAARELAQRAASGADIPTGFGPAASESLKAIDQANRTLGMQVLQQAEFNTLQIDSLKDMNLERIQQAHHRLDDLLYPYNPDFNPTGGFFEHGVRRAVLNRVADRNEDGHITFGEMKQLDKDQFRQLAQESGGFEPAQIDAFLEDLPEWISYEESQHARQSKVVVSYFAHYALLWQYKGDEGNSVISGVCQRDQELKELRQEQTEQPRLEEVEADLQAEKASLLELVDNDPNVVALVDQLEANCQLSFENLHYLKTIQETHGTKTLSAVCKNLTAFGNTDKGRFGADARMQIIHDVLHDLAYPSDIDQGKKGTCAAAAVQMKLAIMDPLKYADICTTLAQDQTYSLGEAGSLRHNTTYLPQTDLAHLDDPDAQKDSIGQTDTRSLSCKIMQNAMMDYAHSTIPDHPTVQYDGQSFYYDSRLSVDPAQGLSPYDTREQVAQNYPELSGLSGADLAALGSGLNDSEWLALEQAICVDQGQIENQKSYPSFWD
ncbi:MAG TPA: hypothetical protein V6D23_11415, partial [Candidatus Obscuribacterales bacterium]